jgi:hypothetical protein
VVTLISNLSGCQHHSHRHFAAREKKITRKHEREGNHVSTQQTKKNPRSTRNSTLQPPDLGTARHGTERRGAAVKRFALAVPIPTRGET